jgi:hypothetical protein
LVDSLPKVDYDLLTDNARGHDMSQINESVPQTNEMWRSARFTKTLPRLSVPEDLHDMVHDYAADHEMKLAEVMRKAIYFFLASEFTNSTSQVTDGKREKSKRTKKAKKAVRA